MMQFIRFSLVGVLNTLLHFCIFFVLFEWFGWHHLVASGSGFVVAVINSYLMNRYWTFRLSAPGSAAEFTRFMTVSAVALLVNLMSMLLLVELFMLYPPMAQVISILFTLVVNFLGNKHWSFRAT